MPETFVPLCAWLAPARAPEPLVHAPIVHEAAPAIADDLDAYVRRLRAGILEALEGECSAQTLATLRVHAQALLDRLPP